jgi:hypothetical protein
MAETDGEKQSKQARADSVERMLNDEPPPKEPTTNDPAPNPAEDAADDVGESVTRRGEDIVKDDGKEPGRKDTGTEGAGRPTGTSTPRDQTGVNPQESEK